MKVLIFSRLLKPETLICQISGVSEDLSVQDAIEQLIWTRFEDIFKGHNIHVGSISLRYSVPGVDIEPLDTLPQRFDEIKSQMRTLRDYEPLAQLQTCNTDQVQLTLDVWTKISTPVALDPAEDDHRKTLLRLTQSPPPSDMGDPVKFGNYQNKSPIYNGRPAHLHTTSLPLYHPVFADLKDKLSDLSKVADPTIVELALTGKLFTLATAIYASEKERQAAMMPVIEDLLGQFTEQLPVYDGTGTRVAQGDFTKLVTLLDGIARIVSEGEFKNELLGSGQTQAGLTYGLRIAHASNYDMIRNSTCCPAVILTFAGPYFSVSGAALVDVFIHQSFTDFIYLGGNPGQDMQLIRVAKILKAVADALNGLETYYNSVEPSANPIVSRLMPQPVPHETLPGHLVFDARFRYKGGRPNSRRSLFKGTLDDKPVLIKFCETYSPIAHRLLAKHDPPLAPQLHFFSEVQDGLKMVVMDFVEGQDAHYQFANMPLPPSVRADIEKAKNVLHDDGWVFGDLRRPNVMVIPKRRESREGVFGAMLIDFDWVGKAGEARYPLVLNISGDIHWADGVEPGSIMETVHDDAMFARLDFPATL